MKEKLIFVIIILCQLATILAFNAPEWSKDLSIYEVNIRQYTEEGTFAAFQQHLPRLQEMRVGILWLMPINPIGELNRKGSLGSYYACSDYLDVNPEFGTKADFKALVDEIHERGKQVLFVGGTALYLKALICGIFQGPPANWEFRDAIQKELAESGLEQLHQRLAQVDPISAHKLHPNDQRRVIRALEVYSTTGQPISHLRTNPARWV